MYITFKLVAEDARKEGLAKDPEVIKAVKRAEDQILREAWAAKKGQAAISDAELKKRYDEGKANFKPQEEVHAHHILVDTEEQAKQIISDLHAGASFEDLAKTKSKDPTGARSGGDLGFFTHDQMVPEFADAAFALRAGETSTTPVKTQFGWHVIRVDEHRMQSWPSLDDANFKAYLRQQIAQENVQKAVMDLRSKAKIEMKTTDTDSSSAPAKK
jgi:peptidyl-prolyl cis-trans isomerase C